MLFGDKRDQAGAITICFPCDMATKTIRNAIWRQKSTKKAPGGTDYHMFSWRYGNENDAKCSLATKTHQAGAITLRFPSDMATKTMRNAHATHLNHETAEKRPQKLYKR